MLETWWSACSVCVRVCETETSEKGRKKKEVFIGEKKEIFFLLFRNHSSPHSVDRPLVPLATDDYIIIAIMGQFQ